MPSGRPRLQWGRGLLTPEILKPEILIAAWIALQWGRGLLTPEMNEFAATHPQIAALQWGRGLLTPEMQERPQHEANRLCASMGPGSFDPGNRRAAPTAARPG